MLAGIYIYRTLCVIKSSWLSIDDESPFFPWRIVYGDKLNQFINGTHSGKLSHLQEVAGLMLYCRVHVSTASVPQSGLDYYNRSSATQLCSLAWPPTHCWWMLQALKFAFRTSLYSPHPLWFIALGKLSIVQCLIYTIVGHVNYYAKVNALESSFLNFVWLEYYPQYLSTK